MTTKISMLAIDLAKGSFQVSAVGPDRACVDGSRGARARHSRNAGVSDRRGVGDTDFEVQGRDTQTRGSSARSSLNRCEPSLPNSIPARAVIPPYSPKSGEMAGVPAKAL